MEITMPATTREFRSRLPRAHMHAGVLACLCGFIASLLIACSASPVTETTQTLSDSALLCALADGSAELTQMSSFSGYSEAMAEARAANHLRGLYDTRNWETLAVSVMRAGCGSDLSWFYLGRAAEETGHTAAARIYFQSSVIAAQKKGVSGCIACSGFKFPDDSEARLNSLNQLIGPGAIPDSDSDSEESLK